MKWYQKVGYKIIETKKAKWVIRTNEWWIGGFETKEEAEKFVEYLW